MKLLLCVNIIMDSASLKIERASEHINEINKLFRKQRPFSYVVETNAKLGERSTFAKRNEPIIKRTAILCGDVLHSLRSAIDHAYWDVVSRFVPEEDFWRVQFPFSKTKAGLHEAAKKRMADKVSSDFFRAIIELKPYCEQGGNELLYAIHELNIIDKHKLLIPAGSYTRISSDMIKRHVPDFPQGLSNVHIGHNERGGRDVVWRIPTLNRNQRRAKKIPKSGILEKDINVPVDIIFSVAGPINSRPIIPTLNKLVDVTQGTISIIKNYA